MSPLEWGPLLYGKFFASHHPVWGYLFACTIGLLLATAAWTGIKYKYEAEHPHAVRPELQIAYDMLQTLPIVIPPAAQFYIVEFHSNRKSSVTLTTNNGAKESYWPKKAELTEFIGLCRLGNPGNKIVFNVSLTFGIHFKHPGRGMPDLAYVKQEVLINGSIKPGDYSHIYLVNESPYDVVVDLPEDAVLQVQGESSRGGGKINRLMANITDQFPPVFGPSRNKR